jgi:ligand-binding sensor domain-containing protein
MNPRREACVQPVPGERAAPKTSIMEKYVGINDLRTRGRSSRRAGALAFVAALCAGTAAHAESSPAKTVQKTDGTSNDKNAPTTKGEIVSELGKSVMYVLQARNNHYWFGSNDRGAYRYDGKSLVNFTTKDGLVSNRIRGIQEDKSGNVYFTTYEGISKFDGRTFTTLSAPAKADATEWKLRPDDLWFVGPPDAGVVFRYDGKSLHRLKFPRTKLGDEHFEKMPRSKFPNAIYSPYDVYCIVRDSKGNLWFGSTCVGVCRYDGKSFDWLTDKTLVEAPVRSILEDKKGNFWFSYSGHAPFEGFRAVHDFGKLQDRAEGNIVEGMSIVEDDDGKLWTAALSAGVFRHDGKRKVGYPIKEGQTAIEVFAVYKDNRGVLWLGTHNGGAYRFNGKAFERFKV